MHSLRTAFSLAFAVAAFGALSPALAQNGGMASGMASGDSHFVAGASSGGMTEVAASKLAATHAASTTVKDFAATMVTDHTKAGEQLGMIARKTGMTPASAPTAEQQAGLTKLQGLNGAAFDKAYSTMMVKDHAEAVALFRQEAASGKQADLQQFAKDTLPTLEQHQSMAAKLPAGM